ncbi:MAG: TRAP transporter large permease subunit [Peptococcaceae bacterium]
MADSFLGPVPMGIAYLIFLLVFMAVVFLFLKRPIYEVMILSFVFVILITQRWDLFWPYLLKPSTSGLFYAIVGFLTLAHIFGETKVVDKIINFILATVGRFRGGGGYVSLIASTFMAALSGTGPGNVAATGVFTIPSMKKTGFSPELAATVEMSCSSLGNIVPPSGTILLCYGVYNALYPNAVTLAAFWMICWGVAIWFIGQRWLTLLGFCYYYKVEPIPAEERPGVGQSFKEGWQSLLIPLIIFIPIFALSKYGGVITARLGEEGGNAIVKSALYFTPGVAALYGLYIGKDALNGLDFVKVYEMLKRGISIITPVAATIYVAYAIALVFQQLGMEESVQSWFMSMGLSKTALAFILPVFTAFLGMVLPGSSQVAIIGGALVAAFAALGGNPLLLAVMLPALTGALEGMTPPLALCLYAAMGIAESDFTKTAKLAYVWVGLHMLVCILILLGILPVLGI